MHNEVARRRFTVADYYKMAEAGILRDDDRVELIDGQVFQVSAIGSRHAATVYCADSALKAALGAQAIVRVQLPIRIDDFNEPEPDIAVVRTRRDKYVHAHPAPSDAHLLIEVSDTTSKFDREVKAPLYAIAGIGEFWIVDLHTSQALVFRNPAGDRYQTITVLGRADTVSPLSFPDIRLPVSELFP